MERVRGKLPVYQGELYLEFHRGTYTTQSEFKRLHRGAERALQAHEAVRVATDGKPLGEQSWLRVLFSEFHDAIPGSSINIVYQELNPELAAVAARELEGAVSELKGKGPGWSVFNPSPLARRAVVGVGEKAVPVLVSLAGLEGKPLEEAMTAPENAVKEASPGVLDNGLVRAEFAADGSLTGLSVEGTALDIGRGLFGLYADEPANFDAWDIDHHVMKRGSAVGPLKLRVVESGPLRAVLEGTTRVGEKSRLIARYILEADCRWLRVEAEVEWQEHHKLLKYHAQTGYRGRFSRYGCPFGSILRPQQPGDTADEAMWEVPGSRWAAVTREDGTGLAVVTEAKYGFSCRDGDLGLSLLRATKSPDHAADMGRHLIRFALGEHEPAERDGVPPTAGAADALFAPVLLGRGSREVEPPFTLEDLGSLVPSWVLPCEESGGYIVRLHETNGSSGTAILRPADPKAVVDFVDFLERRIGGAKRSPDGGWLVPYSPYRIVSARVRRG
jgi:alpha-mannosidase